MSGDSLASFMASLHHQEDWTSPDDAPVAPASAGSAAAAAAAATRRRTSHRISSQSQSRAASEDPSDSAVDGTDAAAQSQSQQQQQLGTSPPPLDSTITKQSKSNGSANNANNNNNSSSKSKRKKASRACNACQKAHLTCDDARPCGRCIKRGLEDTCQDGKRKKAKYLQDYADEVLGRRAENPANQKLIPPTPSQPHKTDQQQPDAHSQNDSQQQQVPAFSASSLLDSPPRSASGLGGALGGDHRPSSASHNGQQHIDPLASSQLFDPARSSNDFGSLAANLEYAVLSSMLHGQTPPSDHNSATTPSSFAPDQMHQQSQGHNGSASLFDPIAGSSSGPGASAGHHTVGADNGLGTSLEHLIAGPSSSSSAGPQGAGHHHQGQHGPFSSAHEHNMLDLSAKDGHDRASSGLDFLDPSPRPHSSSGGDQQQSHHHHHQQHPDFSASSATAEVAEPPVRTACGAMRPQDVYKKVSKPYPYANSYHDLIRHLKERFEKTDILRIVRALAVFRPSLIALQMPLTEEDEVFIERCFQRTLIEFEKLISFSGTPTVCWRRTGEICLVGIEFSLLTQWDRSELVGEGKKRFIFELFDTSSCVEYYESFAKHAFENSTQTIMSTCVLLTPDQKPVPCSFCFTIKRDMFNCPSLVVGQFLPLLLA